jgi:LacI family transcriptional regulator
MSELKNIRIKDIAEMAGVSVATVDRVLHNRGRISPNALRKVMEALEQTGYKPNLIASTLGSNKIYRIAALLPDPALDDYWNQSGAGIFKAREDWSQYHVRIESFYFNMQEKSSFLKAAEKALDFNPDSMLIAPTFHKEAIEFFKVLKTRNIPYILFNTNIPEAEPISFIGQDLYQSGRLGAEMLSTRLAAPGNIAILHVYEEIRNAVHLKEKERGFRDYFLEKGLTKYLLYSYDFGSYSEPELERELISAMNRDQISGLFVSTSKGSYLTASILDNHGKKGIILVGYDLLKNNIHYMYEGVIHYLINQNPGRQAFLGISYLVNYLLFKKQPPLNDLFPLEIITRENLKSYLYAGIH